MLLVINESSYNRTRFLCNFSLLPQSILFLKVGCLQQSSYLFRFFKSFAFPWFCKPLLAYPRSIDFLQRLNICGLSIGVYVNNLSCFAYYCFILAFFSLISTNPLSSQGRIQWEAPLLQTNTQNFRGVKVINVQRTICGRDDLCLLFT